MGFVLILKLARKCHANELQSTASESDRFEFTVLKEWDALACTNHICRQNLSFWFCLLLFQRNMFYQTTKILCDVDPIFTHCNIFTFWYFLSFKVNSVKIQVLSSVSVSICSLQMKNESEDFFSSKSLNYETIKFSVVGAGSRLHV